MKTISNPLCLFYMVHVSTNVLYLINKEHDIKYLLSLCCVVTAVLVAQGTKYRACVVYRSSQGGLIVACIKSPQSPLTQGRSTHAFRVPFETKSYLAKRCCGTHTWLGWHSYSALLRIIYSLNQSLDMRQNLPSQICRWSSVCALKKTAVMLITLFVTVVSMNHSSSMWLEL